MGNSLGSIACMREIAASILLKPFIHGNARCWSSRFLPYDLEENAIKNLKNSKTYF